MAMFLRHSVSQLLFRLLNDVNNYRAIALSNAITKLLEALLFSFIESRDAVDDYQFGFKKDHSTSMSTHILKENG